MVELYNTPDSVAKSVGTWVIDISTHLDDNMQKWSDEQERPDKLTATECVGFINKPTSSGGMNMVVDLQAPEAGNTAKLRLWAIKSEKNNQGVEIFNNIQMDFSVDYELARNVAIKGRDVTRDDIHTVLQDETTHLTRLILSSQSGVDSTTRRTLGRRYDLVSNFDNKTMRDQSSSEVFSTSEISTISQKITRIIDSTR